MKNNIFAKAFNKTVFWAKKNSPELLLIAGIVGIGTTIYLACKETLKAKETIEPDINKIEKIHDDMNNEELIVNERYSVAQGRKDLVKQYTETGKKLVKIYYPAAISLTLTVASFVGSHHIQKGRELAMAAAYKTIETAYKSYRERVKDKIGEEAENDLFHNVHTEKISEKIVDKNGRTKTITKEIKIPGDDPRDFSYCFDESNPNWENDANTNIDWLLMQEKYLNDKLKIRGYMFLSEVYKALGIEPGIIGPAKMQAAQVLGWIYDPEDNSRDSYISLGLSDHMGNLNDVAMRAKRFNEPSVYLTFNPDGDILTGDDNQKSFMHYAKCW